MEIKLKNSFQKAISWQWQVVASKEVLTWHFCFSWINNSWVNFVPWPCDHIHISGSKISSWKSLGRFRPMEIYLFENMGFIFANLGKYNSSEQNKVWLGQQNTVYLIKVLKFILLWHCFLAYPKFLTWFNKIHFWTLISHTYWGSHLIERPRPGLYNM